MAIKKTPLARFPKALKHLWSAYSRLLQINGEEELGDSNVGDNPLRNESIPHVGSLQSSSSLSSEL